MCASTDKSQIKWGEALITLDAAAWASLEGKIRDNPLGGMPIDLIELIPSDEERRVVFRNTSTGHEVLFLVDDELYQEAQKLLEMHLFEKGRARYERKREEWERDWKSTLTNVSQKYFVPFSDGWAAVRNAFGLAIALLHLLILFGVITCPQIFVVLFFVYAGLVLVQGLLSVLPLCLGGAAGGIGQYKMADALGDEKHKTTARLKQWGGFFSLVEGSFWLAIAIADFSGILSLSALLTKILFWGVFNFTFSYMTIVALRDRKRHKKFHNLIQTKLDAPAYRTEFEKYKVTLEFIRDKWRMHLKPKYATWNNEKLIQKAGRKIYRLEEQTNGACLEKMKSVDTLIARLAQDDGAAIKEAEKFIDEIVKANKVKMIADWITIFLGVLGILCWLDIFITLFSTELTAEIVDWTLWIFLNLGFLFLLDWDRFFQKVASYFSHSEAPRMEVATFLPH